MLYLKESELKNSLWRDVGIALPKFDMPQTRLDTLSSPEWIHIAPSNIYRAMVAPIQQHLIESGIAKTGMIAIETHDSQVIDNIYYPHDNLSIRVVMYPDGRNDLMIVGNIMEAIFADRNDSPEGWEKALGYFSSDSLQMVSITCTEKGYNTESEQFMTDIEDGPASPGHIMAKISAFAYSRYMKSGAPIAFVSMDNCSENGYMFRRAVTRLAEEWAKRGFINKGFLRYLDEKVSFPWTMIDRITPRPSEKAKDMLEKMGISGMDIITTRKGTVIAPFVNTEHVSYLVIQDDFPNGRQALEKAGVIFCDSSDDVAKYERMKVGACLNPNQTTLCIFGCLLNHRHIYDAISDPLLKELLYRLSYEESLPVVEYPGKIDPGEFLREVLEERLPNTNIPDTPARIITDTSQKVGVRYGDTIIAHGSNAKNLKYIPLAIAGWCRYLMGIDDNGEEMNYNPTAKAPWNRWSPDPNLENLVQYISPVRLGNPQSAGDCLKPVLSDKAMFGVDLYEVGLGQKIECLFREMIAGVGSVRATLMKHANY